MYKHIENSFLIKINVILYSLLNHYNCDNKSLCVQVVEMKFKNIRYLSLL